MYEGILRFPDTSWLFPHFIDLDRFWFVQFWSVISAVGRGWTIKATVPKTFPNNNEI